MDSTTPCSNRGKGDLESSRSRRVRIVGRVRSFTEQESESSSARPWVRVCKSGEGDSAECGVVLSSSEQSSSRKDGVYKLDFCYEQDEETSAIFTKEIEPLISDVLSGGNASVIAYGAKGSGKTFTIQGTEANPGLAILSMNELLKETGNEVSVSILEVHQEHVYDLLDSTCSEIQILGDGQGKINLKGLSQVPVKCVSEFQNMYFDKVHVSKSLEKIPLEQPKRSHKCLMIHVSKVDDGSNLKREGKMLFIDLAGYKDARRSSRDGNAHHETTKTNMSLQALMNVVYALNANEIHVPYRESKLTRLFQESLRGKDRVVMLTCLNPHFCQDTIHTLSLASRSCHSMNHLLTNSVRGDRSSTRSKLFSSQKVINPSTPTALKKQVALTVNVSAPINPSTTPRTLKQFPPTTPRTLKQVPPTTPRTLKQVPSTTPRTLKKPVASSTPNTFKKHVVSTVSASAKKNTVSKGRPLFHDRTNIPSNQKNPGDCYVNHKKEAVPLTKQPLQDDESTSDHALILLPEGLVSEVKPTSDTSLELGNKMDALQYTEENPIMLETAEGVCEGIAVTQLSSGLDLEENVICASGAPEDGNNTVTTSEDSLGEEKSCDSANNGKSPPLSVRLQEMSNMFKSLSTLAPLAKIPEDFNRQPSSQPECVAEFTEPKTPTSEHSTRLAPVLDRTNYASPWDRLNTRSSGMKNSLVQEYLKFLNTADKEELKGLKGIGEKRATYILERRDESPEPFKELDDLQSIGLSAKQAKRMMKNMAGDLFI